FLIRVSRVGVTRQAFTIMEPENASADSALATGVSCGFKQRAGTHDRNNSPPRSPRPPPRRSAARSFFRAPLILIGLVVANELTCRGTRIALCQKSHGHW